MYAIAIGMLHRCIIAGTDSIDGVSDVKYNGVTCSVFETNPKDSDSILESSDIQKSLTEEINHQFGGNLDNEGFSGSNPTPLGDSFEEQNIKSKPFNTETRLAADFDLIEETDREVTEFDVERVLEKQNTHDLYCPNCNSCITRRVILRRRRKVRNIRRKPKHDKLDTILLSELDANSTHSANSEVHDTANIGSNGSPTPTADGNNFDRQPDIFRCLSCFSFFIPAGIELITAR